MGLQVPARTGLAEKAALKQKAGSECFMMSIKVCSTTIAAFVTSSLNSTRHICIWWFAMPISGMHGAVRNQ